MLVADYSGYQAADIGQPLRDAGFQASIGQPLGNPHYRQQVISCNAYGLQILAAYAFAYPGSGTQLCDDLLASLVGPEEALVIDAEVAGISPEEVLQFGRRAYEWNPNKRPILYASTSYIRSNYSGTPEIATLFDAWIAEYHNDLQPTNLPPAPPPFQSWIGWQYTSSYDVPGLGLLDASVWTGSTPTPPITHNMEDDMLYSTTDAGATTFYRDAGGILVALKPEEAAPYYDDVVSGKIVVVALGGVLSALAFNANSTEAWAKYHPAGAAGGVEPAEPAEPKGYTGTVTLTPIP